MSIPKQHPKRTSSHPKTSNKVDKTAKFADKSNKESKDSNKIPEGKTVKTSSKKNTTPHTVSEIQASNLDQNIDTDENESGSMGLKTSLINILCLILLSAPN